MSTQRTLALALVAVVCVIVQTLSATFLVRDFATPNASTEIATNLVERGEYASALWRREPGVTGRAAGEPYYAFQLPGEPLYLAAGFKFLPGSMHRYLHVPISTLLVVAISAIAFMVGGRSLALATAMFATFDPFIVVHGPVWDDTLLAASMEWLIVALLMSKWQTPSHAGRRSWITGAVLFVAAAWAASARLQSQVILGLAATAAIAVPRLRPIRREGVAIAAGVILALAAWGLRNYVVLGTFLIGSTHEGQTLLHANHPHARVALVETGVTHTGADLSLPAGLGEIAENRAFRERALQYLVSEPFDALLTAGLKTAVSLTGLDFSAPAWGMRNLVAVGSNLLLLVLGARGWWVWRREQPAKLLAAHTQVLAAVAGLVAIITLGMLAIGPVGLRYRVSLAPVLYLGAAYAIRTRVDSAKR